MRRVLLVANLLVGFGALLLAGPAMRVVTGLHAQASGVSPIPASPGSLPLRARRPADGEAMGRLELPRLGLDLVVFEGVSDATLRKGPGHLPGTAWPNGTDAGGNCVIAGHRDSFFRRLADARQNDLVRFHGPSGTSTYRLAERRIVKPEDAASVAPTRDARLTLITCYPFSWTGSAPYRLVWKAERIEPKSAQTGDFRIASP
jgi:sortase A